MKNGKTTFHLFGGGLRQTGPVCGPKENSDTMYRDHEFDPVTPEEQAAASRTRSSRAACAARCCAWSAARRRAEEDIRADEEREAEERAEAEERERRERRRRSSTFWQLFSGTILVREGVSKYYPYMLTIAGMFFLSIMVMFWSLHLDMRYTRLERDVQKLRERSIRLQEQRYQRTTHSAIVEQLRARGIELYDPQAPGEIIEN